MQTLRIPDERFVDLPDFPFEPRYAGIADGDDGTLRVRYLDEGPSDAPPVLLMQGEPSWCFLYRHMSPPLVAAWEVLSRFERPFVLCFSDHDPVTRGGDAPFLAKVPGARDQPHVTIEGGGHFLQEDRGPELARLLVDFIGS